MRVAGKHFAMNQFSEDVRTHGAANMLVSSQASPIVVKRLHLNRLELVSIVIDQRILINSSNGLLSS